MATTDDEASDAAIVTIEIEVNDRLGSSGSGKSKLNEMRGAPLRWGSWWVSTMFRSGHRSPTPLDRSFSSSNFFTTAKMRASAECRSTAAKHHEADDVPA